MVVKITVKMTPRTDTYFRKFTNMFLGFNKMRKILNKRIGKKSAQLVIKAMKDAGIKQKSGRLFESVQAVNISEEGFDVQLEKLGAILHHGRPDGYEIRSKLDTNILANPQTGFIVSTKYRPIRHRLAARPWFERAETSIFSFLKGKYTVEIEGIIRKSVR